MTDDQKQNELITYRLNQAEETLDEAVFLFNGRKNPRSVINRLYYSMFYSVMALLVKEPYASSKHSGVISYFNKRFIKEGIFHHDLGKSINEAFELRQSCDYEEYIEMSREEIEPFIGKTRLFNNAIKKYINENK